MVCVSASIQLNPKEMASTTNRGFTISATAEGARYNGRNEQMAMNVAPSNPHCGPVAPSISAFRRFIPRAMAICAIVRHYDSIIHQHTHGNDETCQ